MRAICNGLEKDGILLLCEKGYPWGPRKLAGLQNWFYHAFKRENGYSELEISQKRDALEKVLIPETVENTSGPFAAGRLRRGGCVAQVVQLRCLHCRQMTDHYDICHRDRIPYDREIMARARKVLDSQPKKSNGLCLYHRRIAAGDPLPGCTWIPHG